MISVSGLKTLAVSAMLSCTALAAHGDSVDSRLGTVEADVPSARSAAANAELAIGRINRSFLFNEADLASGGAALRNRGSAVIHMSDVKTPVKAAFLYWAVITSGAPVPAARSLYLQRITPGDESAEVRVQGVRLGSGASPCWGGNTTTVFRGRAPANIVNANGLYRVRLFRTTSAVAGSINGENPWSTSPIPAWEGASLFVVGTGTGRVALFDKRLSGKTFIGGTLEYTLFTPFDFDDHFNIILHIAGADGQRGFGYPDSSGISMETTEINGALISGPGSQAHDSDWNGAIGSPLPQLWDTMAHDVTSAAKADSLKRRLITKISAGTDCLVPVANGVVVR